VGPGYQPIADYGVIGDLHSVGLAGKNGCIDWCCLPRFDSPSIFAAILDREKGGYYRLAAEGECAIKQMYLPDTNILVTRFHSEEGMGEVIDFMPVGRESGGHTEQSVRQIIRIAKAVHGNIRYRMECRPAFDYARQPHTVELDPNGRNAVFRTPKQQFALKSTHPMRQDGLDVVSSFTLMAGEEAVFALRHREGKVDDDFPDDPLDGQQLLNETARFWRSWVSRSRYQGRWREIVTRSALVLKLMTYQPTGAIVAAPTTSLPESIGGVRNWDYRYTWVRDAAFTVYSLMRLGYTEEAGAFARFMQERTKQATPNDGPLQVMYTIDGSHDIPEITLDHLEGYRGSRPVRIGNAASGHLQLDIYGELMDALYLYNKYGQPLSHDMWSAVETLLDWVVKNWEQPDRSIWEVRGPCRHFTYSKMQCWVALDRGVRLAAKRSFPGNQQVWQTERDRIYRTIMSGSWRESEGAFTQAFDSDALDCSVLLMPLMLFASPVDPRVVSTIDRVRQRLASDALVLRYDTGEREADDGLPGREGFFSVCSFWLVEAMARAGNVEEAQLLFEKLLSYANHLGLYSEEISSRGDLLGNYPQALTHLGLISAAFNLDRLLGKR
jgi:GH15 family glucan-1,4-alpha-glucosidase